MEVSAMKKIIVLLLVIGAVCISAIITINFKVDNSFNQEIWNTDLSKRKEMLKDLINSNQIIGKSKAELIDLLGENYKITDSDTSLGYIVATNLGDPLCFIIFFDDNGIAYKYGYATP